MAGLTSTGLTIKTQDDVVTANKLRAANIFADLVPTGDTVDTGDNSLLGRLIGVVSPAEAEMWEAIQQIYNSFQPQYATGIALDNIVALSGITRLAATATRAQVILEATTGTIISSPAGAVSSSTTQRTFSFLNSVTMNVSNASGIGISVSNVANNTVYTVSYSTDNVNYITATYTSGTGATSTSILAGIDTAVQNTFGAVFTTYYQDGRLFITRTDPFQIASFAVSTNLLVGKVRKLGIVVDDVVGVYPQVAYAIDTISVPIAGWDSVVNPAAATTGRLSETDAALRERWSNSKYVQSQNILEALIDALKNVDGVTDVAVYENDTDAVDINGVNAHSFYPIVLGGLASDIAEAIWENKPTGIPSQGTTTVQIADSQGILHSISYKSPDEVPIYVVLSVSDAGGIAGDAIATIRQNIIDYATENYLIGDDVIYSRLYTPINAVPNHMVNSLYIGTSANPTTMANIDIDFDAVAVFNAANISITID